MKDKLKEMYAAQMITESGLLNAVSKSWITLEDVVEILGEENAIEIMRNAKLAEISKVCNIIIEQGFDIEFNGESVHFNLDLKDQSNINNLFRVVELGGTEYPYQSDGGVCRIYTSAEIVNIYVSAQTLITSQTTYHNALKQYVQSLETTEEIATVTYGMELPEPYLTEMNEKLAVAQSQMQVILGRLSEAQNL